VSVILVSGAIANKSHQGGEAWVRMSWATGLRRLGFDVYFVEQIAGATCVDSAGSPAPFHDCDNRIYFDEVMRQFGFAGRSALISNDGESCLGMDWDRLLEIARSTELLVNISGHLSLDRLTERVRRKAYVDIDPGFTQFWHADRRGQFRIAPHDHYFTIGENIGRSDCPIPTGGLPWKPVRQPVVLDDWPISRAGNRARFTTVANWRGPFGPVQIGERTFGLKVHEFRKYLSLPRLAAQRCAACGAGLAPEFELALNIHPGDARDLAALQESGWRISNPARLAGSPKAFGEFVRNSGAEFSVAQGIYVETRSGWFSDRTVRYLASGKPALVQETGFARNLPTGEGLIGFSSPDEAAEGAARIMRDYEAHASAARTIAEDCFDSDKVLRPFLSEVGLGDELRRPQRATS
jgi:hypothetical protein